MTGPGTGVRVYLACGVTDMRKGLAGLSALAQDVLRHKPASGAVFAFRGRRGDRLKLLYWDGPLLAHASMRCRAAGVLPVL
ncbi:MAG: transposase [Paracoccaceae bacterium]|jgi:transposase